MVGVRVSVSPIKRSILFLSNDTPLTETGLTVTAQEAVLLPLAVVTVIVADPTLTPVTVPLDDTVATLVLLLFQLTDLFVA